MTRRLFARLVKRSPDVARSPGLQAGFARAAREGRGMGPRFARLPAWRPGLRRALFSLTLLLAACRQDMHDQPKYQPFERNKFFEDQRASRPLVPGVVARGHLDEDQVLYTGASGGAPVATNPLPVTRDLMLRGRERYNIYCSPCHDRVGAGEGMIVQRGYKQPPTFHSDRLRTVPDGYFFQVMTNGFATMPSYAPQVTAADRWAIVAYIRALQYSQHARLDDVPESERAKLGAAP